MFTSIMVPVDLAHTDEMTKALEIAADLAKRYHAKTHIVGVTHSAPSGVARSPEDFSDKLLAFAHAQSQDLGVMFEARTEMCNDIAVELDAALERAAEAIGADLIVMASHVPGFTEHIFASNAGYLAAHSSLSVLVVR